MKKRKRIMKQVICLIVAIAMLITMTPDCLMNIHQVKAAQKEEKENITEKSYTSNGCSVKYETKSGWGNQVQIDISITNDGEKSMKLSELRFVYQARIINIWNASIASEKEVSGAWQYVLTPESYNKLLNAGESINIGFIAEGVDLPQAPDKIEIEGEREDPKGAVGDTADFGGYCRITTEVSNQWDGGIIGKIILENTGKEILKGWKLHFVWDGQIDNIWNAVCQKDKSGYSINPMNYNSEIAVGGKVEIGFQASGKEKDLERFGKEGFISKKKMVFSSKEPEVSELPVTPPVDPVFTDNPETIIPECTATDFRTTAPPEETSTVYPVTAMPAETNIEESTEEPMDTDRPEETKMPSDTEGPFVTKEPEEESRGDYHINSDIVLEEDLICDNLYIHGNLYTNGKKVIVKKNIIQEGSGGFYIQHSDVSVKEDYVFAGGKLNIEESCNLSIGKNFEIFQGIKIYQHFDNKTDLFTLQVDGDLLYAEEKKIWKLYQTNLKLGGNLQQTGCNCLRYDEPNVSEDFTITFIGKKEQEINIWNGCDQYFGTLDAREAKCVKFPESQIYAVNLYGLSKIETPPKPEAPDLSGIDPDEIEPGEEIPDRGYDLHVDNVYVENGEDHLKRNTYLTEGNLYITNGSLKIDGNLQLYKTKVIMPEGKLQVSENLELCKSQIVMTEGRLQVDGDLINNNSTVGYNSGDIHIKGRTEQREGSIYFYDNCRLEFDQDVEFPDGGNFNLYGDSVTCIFHGNFNQGSSGFFSARKGDFYFEKDYLFRGDYGYRHIQYTRFNKDCKIYFSGDKTQKIELRDAKTAYWGSLDFCQSKDVWVNNEMIGYEVRGIEKVHAVTEDLAFDMEYLYTQGDGVISGNLKLLRGRLFIKEGLLQIRGNLLTAQNSVDVYVYSQLTVDKDINSDRDIDICVQEQEQGKSILKVGGDLNVSGGGLFCGGNAQTKLKSDVNINRGFSFRIYNSRREKKEATIDIAGNLNITGYCGLEGDGTLFLHGDYYQKNTSYQKYFLGKVAFMPNKSGVHKLDVECPETMYMGNIDLKQAGTVYSSNATFYGRSISGLDHLKYDGDTLHLNMDDWTLEQDEKISSDLLLDGNACNLNGHLLQVDGNLVIKNAKKLNFRSGGQLKVSGDVTIQGDEKTEIDTSFDKNQKEIQIAGNLILSGTAVSYSGDLELVVKKDFNIKENGSITYVSDWKKYQYQMTCHLTGNLVQETSSTTDAIQCGSQFTVVLEGEHQKISLPHVEKMGNVNAEKCKDVVMCGKIYGCTLNGIEKVVPEGGNIVSRFDKNIVTSDWTLPGDLLCLGSLAVQDHTVKIEGNYDQNSDTSVVRGSLLIGKDYRAKAGRLTIGEKKEKNSQVKVKGNVFIRRNACVSMGEGTGTLFDIDGELLIASSGTTYADENFWSGGELRLAGNLRTNTATNQTNVWFGKTRVILDGCHKQIIDTRKSYFPIWWLELDMEQAREVYFTNTIISAGNIIGFEKIKNEAITVKNAQINLQQDEKYNGELLLIDSTLNLRQHKFRVNGTLEQISTVMVLNGGTLHTNGYHIAGSSVLQMVNPDDQIWVEGDFSMKSSLNHQHQISDGKMKLTGDFLQEGDKASFASSYRFTIAFTGDCVQHVHFDDEINSKFANVDPAFSDYQMDDTPLYMTARLSYHIAIGMIQGFRTLLGDEKYSALVIELVAGLGVTAVLTAAFPEAALVMLAGEAAVVVGGMMSAYMAVNAVKGLYGTSDGTGSIYEKAEEFAKNSTILIVNVFGTMMSARELAQNLSKNFGRFNRILQKQKEKSIGQIIQDEELYHAEAYTGWQDAMNQIKGNLTDSNAERDLQKAIQHMREEQWRDIMETVQKCRKELGERLDQDDIKCMLEAMGDEEKDIPRYVKAQKRTRMYAAWSTIKNGDDFEKYALEIGRNNDLTIEQRVERLQELFEQSTFKKDIHVPRDAKYVKEFSEEGYVIYDWPEKEGFVQAHSITRKNPLPEIWDRYGRMNGSNFADVPKKGKYSYEQRSIPYYDNEAAYHIGRFRNETYFDKIDAIRDNEIEKLNKLLKQENLATISAGDFAKIRGKYTEFISKIRKEMPDVDAAYGLRGKTAPMGDMEGGANQFLTPLSGDALERLGILTEYKK